MTYLYQPASVAAQECPRFRCEEGMAGDDREILEEGREEKERDDGKITARVGEGWHGECR